MTIYFVLLVVRLATGRDWATMTVAVALFAPLFLGTVGSGPTELPVFEIVLGLISFTAGMSIMRESNTGSRDSR